MILGNLKVMNEVSVQVQVLSQRGGRENTYETGFALLPVV